MIRALCVVGMLLVFFTACSRSADPLDWKVRGDTPDELQHWMNDNLPLMPRPLAEELAGCVRNIQVLTPAGFGDDSTDRARNLTRKLEGKTVRDILIAGHEITNRSLVASVQAQARMVTRFIDRHDDLTSEQQAAIADRQRRIERSKRQLAESDRRLAELRAGRPAP